MGSRMSPKDATLYQAVDEVMHYIWDPIGVRGVPQARDEYHSYVPQVFGLLMKGENREKIGDYLGQVTSDTMGLTGKARDHDLMVADILINWKAALDEKFS